MLTGKKALLLDMNGTFMFGQDRFGDNEDFFNYYTSIGGMLTRQEINNLIRAVYASLYKRYSDEKFQQCFPSVETAVREVLNRDAGSDELAPIIKTFSYHELGYIPKEYAKALHTLSQRFFLAAVTDIWAPKEAWLETLQREGVLPLFSAMSFSSDHGMVKPSPEPFEIVLDQLGLSRKEAVVIGDSPRRDLGGAINAGIDCILVGGAEHTDALGSVTNLLALCELVTTLQTTNTTHLDDGKE